MLRIATIAAIAIASADAFSGKHIPAAFLGWDRIRILFSMPMKSVHILTLKLTICFYS